MSIRQSIESQSAKVADKAVTVDAQERPGHVTAWEVGPLGGQIADIATTALALRQAGLQEGNAASAKLQAKSFAMWGLLKLGLGVGAGVAVRLLHESGRERASKALSVVATAAGLGPAVLNVKTMTEGR